MTDLGICDLLVDFLSISCPADMTLALTGVGTTTLQFGTSIGSINDWVGGIVEMLDGPAVGLQFVITSSTTTTISVSSPFNSMRMPVVGNSVKLTGGPLQAARKYLLEPTSIAQDINQGIKHFVVVNCVSGALVPDTMNGGRVNARAVESCYREYSLEVEISTPNATGVAGSPSDAFRIISQLPMLKEQVMTIIQWFRMQETNRMSGTGPIEYTYAMMERAGMQVPFLCCVVEFKVQITQ